MNIAVDMAWITTVLLVALRLGAVLVFSPLFTVTQVPGRVRALFVLALAAVMVSGLSMTVAVPLTVGELTRASLNELVLGGMLGFGLLAAFGVFQLAGRIADIQLGFGVATLIDPATRTQAPLLGTMLNLLALMVFFAIDGHLLLLQGIAYSLQQFPPAGGLKDLTPAVLVAQFGQMFIFATMLIAPVMLIILVTDVVVAVIARSMPQVNVFIVSLPLKIFIGLVVLALSLRYLSPVFRHVFEAVFNGWHEMLG